MDVNLLQKAASGLAPCACLVVRVCRDTLTACRLFRTQAGQSGQVPEAAGLGTDALLDIGGGPARRPLPRPYSSMNLRRMSSDAASEVSFPVHHRDPEDAGDGVGHLLHASPASPAAAPRSFGSGGPRRRPSLPAVPRDPRLLPSGASRCS